MEAQIDLAWVLEWLDFFSPGIKHTWEANSLVHAAKEVQAERRKSTVPPLGRVLIRQLPPLILQIFLTGEAMHTQLLLPQVDCDFTGHVDCVRI